jgi:hypothetical protein
MATGCVTHLACDWYRPGPNSHSWLIFFLHELRRDIQIGLGARDGEERFRLEVRVDEKEGEVVAEQAV